MATGAQITQRTKPNFHQAFPSQSSMTSAAGRTSGTYISTGSSQLAEERTFLVYHPNALSFEESKADDGTLITISQIIDSTNIELSTAFGSTVDISRFIFPGDLVFKINDEYVDPNLSLSAFHSLIDAAFNKATHGSISITILKVSSKESGKLHRAPTVKNALRWKSEQEARYRDPRYILKRRLDSIYVQLFIFILIIIDVTIFIIAEKHRNNGNETWNSTFHIITFVILGIYATEIMLRIYAMRPKIFFKDPLEVIDLIVVVASLILALLERSEIAVFVSAVRSMRAFRFLRLFKSLRVCIRTTKTIRNAPRSIRQVVRLNKQGYHDDEFDLDLCYITQHVIAMSLPSTGFEKMYRNPINDVAKFLDQHHGERYMIFDLCLERSYDKHIFHDHVTHYKFQDHGVPTISCMFKLCNGISEWVDAHNDNCVAVHCKGGKGRTGTMICAWLLYRYPDATPNEAIDLFATMRTNQIKSAQYQGIETYSQRRYVEYFGRFIKDPQLLEAPYRYIEINKISVGPLFKDAIDESEEEINLVDTQWIARIVQRDETSSSERDIVYTFASGIRNEMDETITFIKNRKNTDNNRLCGNICVLIVQQTKPEPTVFASFWIHTYFIGDKQEIIVPKLECDKLHKDKKHEKAPSDMSIRLEFATFLDDAIVIRNQ